MHCTISLIHTRTPKDDTKLHPHPHCAPTQTSILCTISHMQFHAQAFGVIRMIAIPLSCLLFCPSLDARAISAGGYYSMVLKRDGSVWATGCNGAGQLGTGNLLSSKIFLKVVPSGQHGAMVQTTCNHRLNLTWIHPCADTHAHTHKHTRTTSSRLDRLQTTVIAVCHSQHVCPPLVPAGARAISTGADFSMVLKQDGSVWATGRNDIGQIGDGITSKLWLSLRFARTTFIKVVPSGQCGASV